MFHIQLKPLIPSGKLQNQETHWKLSNHHTSTVPEPRTPKGQVSRTNPQAQVPTANLRRILWPTLYWMFKAPQNNVLTLMNFKTTEKLPTYSIYYG